MPFLSIDPHMKSRVSRHESKDLPVIAFSETLPEGQTYISWMQTNIEALSVALGE